MTISDYSTTDLTIAAFTLLITAFGYALQISKIYRQRSSHGVSWQAYLISFITTLTMSVFSINLLLMTVCLIESAMIAVTMGFILSYKDDEREPLGPLFWLSFALSLVMVRGVMQAVVSYKHRGYSHVSIRGYSMWVALNIGLLILAKSPYVITGLTATTAMFLFIITRTYKTNRRQAEMSYGA